ncbi:MAG: NADPH:quinone reductase [Candidatus Wallbacteria bacterium]|nr:NADPH:quinone reductase [Candidatus Wallbacteria bacterium]
MKAIQVCVFGAPDVMRLAELADPEPAAGQVLVRVEAAGVNPVDTYIRSGAYARKPPLPYTPGMDGAGVVERVGPGVTRRRAGERVYIAGSLSGTYAQRALCLESQVHPLPDLVSFAQGAAVFVPYATAYRALHHCARAVPGEAVLVHGASGGVGLAAVQLARAAGLTVLGTAGTDEGLALVTREGAHHALDHRSPDFPERLLERTAGRGPDVILEMLANVNLARDLELIAPRGRIVVIGSRGPIQIDPRAAMSKDATLIGMSLLNATAEELASVHSALVAGLENGTLRPIVRAELALAAAPAAHELVLQPGARGKIVLTPWGES